MPKNEHLTSELHATKKEVDRLVKNRSVFYEMMSDMVFIINKQYQIEDMNSIAINAFGNLSGTKCFNSLLKRDFPCGSNCCPIKLSDSESKHEKCFETIVGDMTLQYSFVPYSGYQGDDLIMIIMRDITQFKHNEKTIHEFDTNLSYVLQQKIKGLNESEGIRKQLAQEVNLLKKELERIRNPDEMVGENKKIRELRETI